MQILHAAMFQVSRGANIQLRSLAVTENLETQWLLDEIQRQSSVSVLSGPATVITNNTAASAFLADGWSTESVSRVVRTARTRQENNERECAEHLYYSHMHDEMTISDSFAITGPGLEEDENLAENTTAQDDQEDETEQSSSESLQTRRQISKIHENMGHPSNRSLCSGIFVEKVESDGTGLEVTPLEAPWRNGKTGRAGKDWKEDCYKMTQDGPEAQKWTDSEEDCDAVKPASASKINDSRYSAYHRVLGRNPAQMEDAVLECGGADLGVVSWQQTGELAASPVLDKKRFRRRALYHAAKHHKGELHVGQPPLFWRPFHDDDETAHEHVMKHMRDLEERLLHEGDFSYEDITGQHEPPVDSPRAPRENTATGPSGKGQMDVDPEARRRMRGKPGPSALNSQRAHWSTQTLMQHHKRKRERS